MKTEKEIREILHILKEENAEIEDGKRKFILEIEIEILNLILEENNENRKGN